MQVYSRLEIWFKFFAVVFGGIFLVGALFLYLFLYSDLPQSYVKNYLSDYFKESVGVNVSFDAVHGNMHNKIVLKNVLCLESFEKDAREILSIDHIEFSYNFLNFLTFKDPVRSLYSIVIDGIHYFVQRDNEGRWRNIKVRSLGQKTKLPNFSFDGFISIRNFGLHYKDECGWRGNLSFLPFQDSIDNIKGSIEFSRSKGAISLIGQLDSAQTPFEISGYIDLNTFDYSLEFKGNDLDVLKWAGYAIPMPTYHSFEGLLNVDGSITNPKGLAKGTAPLWYDIVFDFQETVVHLPFFQENVVSVNGQLGIHKGKLDSKLFQAVRPYVSQRQSVKLEQELIAAGYIDSKGNIQSDTPDLSKTQFKFADKWLKKPPFILSFNDISGSVYNITGVLNGTVDVEEKWLELAIANVQGDAQDVMQMFPKLERLSLQHSFDAELSIYGKASRPILKGKVELPSLDSGGYQFKDVELAYTYFNDELSLEFQKGFLYEAAVSGNMQINTSLGGDGSASFYLNGVALNKVFVNQDVTGNIDATVHLLFKEGDINGRFRLDSKRAKMWNQSLDFVSGNLAVQDQGVELSEGELYVNESTDPLVFNTFLHQEMHHVVTSGNAIFLFDPFDDSSLGKGIVDVSGAMVLSKSGFNVEQGHFNIDGTNCLVNSFFMDGLELDIKFENNFVNVSKFVIEKQAGRLEGAMKFEPNVIHQLNFSANAFPFIGGEIVQVVFPEMFQLFQGSIGGDIFFERKKANTYWGRGDLRLSNILLDDVEISSLMTSFQFEDHNLFFDSIKIKEQDSLVLGKGVFDFKKGNILFDISDKTTLDQRLIRIFSPSLEASMGSIGVKGSLSMDFQDNYKFSGALSSSFFRFHDSVLEDFSVDIEFDQDAVHISQGMFNVDKGKVVLKDFYLQDSLYRGGIYFDNVDLSYGDFLTWLLDDIQLKKKSRGLDNMVSEIRSPFIEQSVIPLWGGNNNETLFLNDLKLISGQSVYSSEPSFFNSISGRLSGGLSFSGNENQWPIVSGELIILDISSSFGKGDRLRLDFLSKDSNTEFKVELKNTVLNDKFLDNGMLKGRYSKNFEVNLDALEFTYDNIIVSDVVTGLLSKDKLDLQVDLSDQNAAFLGYLFPRIDVPPVFGEFVWHIQGTLKQPTLNLRKSTVQQFEILNSISENEFNQYRVTLDGVVVKNNQISFNAINIDSARFKDEERFRKYKGIVEGKIDFLNLDFSNLSELQSIVNVGFELQGLNLNNSRVNGTLDVLNGRAQGFFSLPMALNYLEEDRYDLDGIDYPSLSGDLFLYNAEILSFGSTNASLYPLNLDLTFSIGRDVFFGGPLVGNDFFGVSADLEFDLMSDPLKVQGFSNRLFLNDSIEIKSGSLTVFNRTFDVLEPSKQYLYAESGGAMKHQVLFRGDVEETLISLKALSVLENNRTVTDNQLLAYTHIVMTLDDQLNVFKEIIFDVYQSDKANPSVISDLEFVRRYYISNVSFDQELGLLSSDINELMGFLFPELDFQTDSEALVSDLGVTQINTLVRRSVFRPLEKRVSRQVGLSDLRIQYNLGEKVIKGTDDVLGVEFVRNIFSDRFVMRLLTEMDLDDSDTESLSRNQFSLSEVELSFLILKNKNLSLNYSQYRDSEFVDRYKSKFSMRYDFEY